MVEREGAVTMRGNPMTLVGPELGVLNLPGLSSIATLFPTIPLLPFIPPEFVWERRR